MIDPSEESRIGTDRPASPRAVPPFEPHPWIKGGHAQTIVSRYWNFPTPRLPATYAEAEVGGGDRVTLLESSPDGWEPGDPVAILVHGLCGNVRSPYVVRVARRLVGLGVRAIRMNLRGAGAGFGASRTYYHSGLSSDLRAVAVRANRLAPGSPIGLVGFSLGANLVLKLAAEASAEPVPGLDCVVAANPPLDLEACSRRISGRSNRVYDRNFVAALKEEVRRLRDRFGDLPDLDLSEVRSVYDFDETYTAPANGFRDAADYYARSSAGPNLSRIRIPGLVIHALDDPFIPSASITGPTFPSQLALELIPRGGHLGYFGRRTWLGDRRWLDARISAWLADHWFADQTPGFAQLSTPARSSPNTKEAGSDAGHPKQ